MEVLPQHGQCGVERVHLRLPSLTVADRRPPPSVREPVTLDTTHDRAVVVALPSATATVPPGALHPRACVQRGGLIFQTPCGSRGRGVPARLPPAHARAARASR